MTTEPAKARLTFRARQRLTHARDFAAVYGARCKATRGPVVVHVRANNLPYWRLGLSIGKRMGNAVARSRFKRLLREAFRLEQNSLPLWDRAGGTSAFDIVVGLYPHEELSADEYRGLLLTLAETGARLARKRSDSRG